MHLCGSHKSNLDRCSCVRIEFSFSLKNCVWKNSLRSYGNFHYQKKLFYMYIFMYGNLHGFLYRQFEQEMLWNTILCWFYCVDCWFQTVAETLPTTTNFDQESIILIILSTLMKILMLIYSDSQIHFRSLRKTQ